jgi:hypothetical protein
LSVPQCRGDNAQGYRSFMEAGLDVVGTHFFNPAEGGDPLL